MVKLHKPSSKKKTRKPSAFNLFMKQELKRVKLANPSLTHKEVFKKAAYNWSDHKKGQPAQTHKTHKRKTHKRKTHKRKTHKK